MSDVDDESDAGTGGRRRDRRQRERVLQLVREHDGAVDAAELASRTGLHVTTVRFHLDALCDDELIVRTRLKLPGRGRPRTGYLAVEEPLDYRVLAGVLAMELGQTVETRGRRAQQAGQKWAARIPEADGWTAEHATTVDDEDPLDRAALRAVAGLQANGLRPRAGRPGRGWVEESSGRRPFGCRPARSGSWPWRIPRSAAGYTWACCRACSPTRRSRRPSTRLTPVDLGPPGTLRQPDLCLAKLMTD